MKQLKHIVFDVDGVLLDTMAIWKDSAKRYLKEVWEIDAPQEIDYKCSTMSLIECGEYVRSLYPHIPMQPRELAEDVAFFIRERYVKAAQTTNMKATICQLKEKGYTLYLATASEEQNVKGALKNHGVWNCFDAIYTCTEIGYSKNKVEYFQEVARRIGVPCKELVMVEDALHSAKTAKKAGFTVVGVYEESASMRWENMQEICDVCIRTLDQLLLYS